MSLFKKIAAGAFGFIAGALTTPFACIYTMSKSGWELGASIAPKSSIAKVAGGIAGGIVGGAFGVGVSIVFVLAGLPTLIVAAKGAYDGYNRGFLAGLTSSFNSGIKLTLKFFSMEATMKAYAKKQTPAPTKQTNTSCALSDSTPMSTAIIHTSANAPIPKPSTTTDVTSTTKTSSTHPTSPAPSLSPTLSSSPTDMAAPSGSQPKM